MSKFQWIMVALAINGCSPKYKCADTQCHVVNAVCVGHKISSECEAQCSDGHTQNFDRLVLSGNTYHGLHCTRTKGLPQ